MKIGVQPDMNNGSGFNNVSELEDALSCPTPALVESLRNLDGDIMVLGAGGKMGPTLARMARRALDQFGSSHQVIAVSRYSDPAARKLLEDSGVRTISCDLFDAASLANLPDSPNIIFMAGMKFGASQSPALTWAMNVYLPGLAASRFPRSNWVVFSSGNIYPFALVAEGGCTEATPPAPVGEYAMSVLGRERIFSHFAERFGTRCLIFRLNYAVEMRYGVLLDIAQKVWHGEPIDLTMGYLNAIWQGDANAIALRCLEHTGVPPAILNVTSPGIFSVRKLAVAFGRLFNREPHFTDTERPAALVANAAECLRLFGPPTVPIGQVLPWVADWVKTDKPTLNKPTKFSVRDGHY
ncbi:MAG: NAD-dependent epimerase/dehydratase family protein [Anaerolineae bacterium]